MTTEGIEAKYADLDQRPTLDVLACLHTSQLQASDAVLECLPTLAEAVEASAVRLRGSDGRLVMLGAGASGRLAIQDGAELWPTYGWPSERLVLKIAGGPEALLSSMDGVEDDADEASRLAKGINLTHHDVVVAVAASGGTPWTCQWMTEAVAAGALAIAIANNPESPLLESADFALYLDSGAEVLAGSTRMAAGTAQKIALNLFSTALMVRLNRTYGNLMVDMAAVNSKLETRRLAMLEEILGELDVSTARDCLNQADGNVKLAVLLVKGMGLADAEALLESVDGSLRQALHSQS